MSKYPAVSASLLEDKLTSIVCGFHAGVGFCRGRKAREHEETRG